MRCKLDPIENPNQISGTSGLVSPKPITSSEAICRTRRVTVNQPSRFVRKFGDKRLPRRLEDMQDPVRYMKNKIRNMKLRSHNQGEKKINEGFHNLESDEMDLTSSDNGNESQDFMDENANQSEPSSPKNRTTKHTIGNQEVRKECIFTKEQNTFYIKVNSSKVKVEQPNIGIQKMQYNYNSNVKLRFLEDAKNSTHMQSLEKLEHPGFVVLENNLNHTNIKDRQQQIHHESQQPSYQLAISSQTPSSSQSQVLNPDPTLSNNIQGKSAVNSPHHNSLNNFPLTKKQIINSIPIEFPRYSTANVSTEGNATISPVHIKGSDDLEQQKDCSDRETHSKVCVSNSVEGTSNQSKYGIISADAQNRSGKSKHYSGSLNSQTVVYPSMASIPSAYGIISPDARNKPSQIRQNADSLNSQTVVYPSMTSIPSAYGIISPDARKKPIQIKQYADSLNSQTVVYPSMASIPSAYGIISPDARNKPSQIKQYADSLNSQTVIPSTMASPKLMGQTMLSPSCRTNMINTHRNSGTQQTDPKMSVMYPVLRYVPQIVYTPYSDMLNCNYPNMENLNNFPGYKENVPHSDIVNYSIPNLDNLNFSGYQTNMSSIQSQNLTLNSLQSYSSSANNTVAIPNSHNKINSQNHLHSSTYIEGSAYSLPEIPSCYCGVPLLNGSSETSNIPLNSTNIDISTNQSSVVSQTSSASLETNHFPGCNVQKTSQLCITSSLTNKNSRSNIGSNLLKQPHTLDQTPSYSANISDQRRVTGESTSVGLPGVPGEMVSSFCEIQPTEHNATIYETDLCSNRIGDPVVPLTKDISKISCKSQILKETIVQGMNTKTRYGQTPNSFSQNVNCRASNQMPYRTESSTNSTFHSLSGEMILSNPIASPKAPTEEKEASKLPEFSVAFMPHLPYESNLHIKQYKEFQLYNSQKQFNNNLNYNLDKSDKSHSKTSLLSGEEVHEFVEENQNCNNKKSNTECKQDNIFNCNTGASVSHLTSDIYSNNLTDINSNHLSDIHSEYLSTDSVIVPKENISLTSMSCDISVQTDTPLQLNGDGIKMLDSFEEVANKSTVTANIDNIVGNSENVSQDLITGNSKNNGTDLVLLKPRDIKECLGTNESLDVSGHLDSLDNINSEANGTDLTDLSSGTLIKDHNTQEICGKTKDHSFSEISNNEILLNGYNIEKNAKKISIDFRNCDEPIDMTLYGNEPLNMSIKKTEPDNTIYEINDLNVNEYQIVTNMNSEPLNMSMNKTEADNIVHEINYINVNKTQNVTKTDNNEIVELDNTRNISENLLAAHTTVNESGEIKKDSINKELSQYRDISVLGALDLSLNNVEPLDMSFRVKNCDEEKAISDIIDYSDNCKAVDMSFKNLAKNSHDSFSNKNLQKCFNVSQDSTDYIDNTKYGESEIMSSQNKVHLFSSKVYNESNNDLDHKDLQNTVCNGSTRSTIGMELVINDNLDMSNEISDKIDLDKKDLDKNTTEVSHNSVGDLNTSADDLNTSIIFEKFVPKGKSLDPSLDTSVILSTSADDLNTSIIFEKFVPKEKALDTSVIIEDNGGLSASPVFKKRNFVSRRLNSKFLQIPKEEKLDGSDNANELPVATDCNKDIGAGKTEKMITKLDIRKLSPKSSTSPQLTTFRPQDIKIPKDKMTLKHPHKDKYEIVFENIEVKQEQIDEEFEYETQDETRDDSGFTRDDSGFYTESTPEYESEQFQQAKQHLLFTSFNHVDGQQKYLNNDLKKMELQKQHEINENETKIFAKNKSQNEQNSFACQSSDEFVTKNISKQQHKINDHAKFSYYEQTTAKDNVEVLINQNKIQQNKECEFRYMKEVDRAKPTIQSESQAVQGKQEDSKQFKKQEHSNNLYKGVEEKDQHELYENDIQNEDCKIDSTIQTKKTNGKQFDICKQKSILQTKKRKYSNYRNETLEEINKQSEKPDCNSMDETKVQHNESLSQTEACETENEKQSQLEISSFKRINQNYQKNENDLSSSTSDEVMSVCDEGSPQSPGAERILITDHNETLVPEAPQGKQGNQDEIDSSIFKLTPTSFGSEYFLNLDHSLSPVISLQPRSRLAKHIFSSANSANTDTTLKDKLGKESDMNKNKINNFEEDIKSLPTVSTFKSRDEISPQLKTNSFQYTNTVLGDPIINAVSGDPIINAVSGDPITNAVSEDRMLLVPHHKIQNIGFYDSERKLPSDSQAIDQISLDKTESHLSDPEITECSTILANSDFSDSIDNNSASSDSFYPRISDKQSTVTDDPGFEKTLIDTHDMKGVELEDKKLKSGQRHQKQRNSEKDAFLEDPCLDIYTDRISQCTSVDESTTFENRQSNRSEIISDEKKEFVSSVDQNQDIFTGKSGKIVFEKSKKEKNYNVLGENIDSNENLQGDKDVDFSDSLLQYSCMDKYVKTSDNKRELLASNKSVCKSFQSPRSTRHMKRNTRSKTSDKEIELFRCNECDYKSVREDHLFRHMKKHARNTQEVFICEFCEINFADYSELHSHRYNTHIKPGESSYCVICDIDFDTSEELENHEKLHKSEIKFTCRECNSTFTSKTSLNIHKRTHISYKSFCCTKCNYSCSKESTFNKHMIIHKDQNNVLSCNECGREFMNQILLSVHSKIHSMKKLFNCSECDFSSSTQKLLQEHVESHKPEECFICTRCNVTFANKTLYETHSKSHDTNQELCCNECSQSFSSAELLSDHMDSFHCGNYETNDTKVSKSLSDDLNSKTEFQDHIIIHKDNDSPNCEIVKENVEIKEGIGQVIEENVEYNSEPHNGNESYLRTENKDDESHELINKIFICTKCNFQTVNIDLFSIHKSNHVERFSLKSESCTSESNEISETSKLSTSKDKKGLYKCSACDYEAISDDSLVMHNHIHAIKQLFSRSESNINSFDDRELLDQLIHKSNNSFHCDICGNNTTDSIALSTHELIHRNEKPFHCEVCGFSTSHRKALIQHMVAQHGGKKIFSCNICTENFTSKTSLKEHLMTHFLGKKGKKTIEKGNSKTLTENSEIEKITKNGSRKRSITNDAIDNINNAKIPNLVSKEHATKEKIQCCYCSNQYSRLSGLNRHYKEKHPNKVKVRI